MIGWTVGVAVALLLAAEAGLWALHRAFRPRFQWLIGPEDESPTIDDALIDKHMAGGFDSELGWVRKPGSSGADRTAAGTRRFLVDSRGRRGDPVNANLAPGAAVFGDSFAFCRLVADDETWPHYLSHHLGRYVANYGVGNYGFDQALLRFEREAAGLEESVVVIAVVPETMARIHSYWKHYFEYGNLLAFKPRFTLGAEGLTLHASPVRSAENYRCYREKLAAIRALDPFYAKKFRRDVLSFPRLLGLLRRGRRHGPILWHLSAGVLAGDGERGRRRAFESVIRANAEQAAALYRDAAARALFSALAERFRDRCHAMGREPLLVVVPQPVDLERIEHGKDDYRCFLAALADIVPVADLTDAFLETGDWRALYVDGPLGPHVGANGNRLIADRLAGRVGALLGADVSSVSRPATA